MRASLSKFGEIYDALKRFKEANKKIYVYADQGISNADYLLVSMADEIYLNEYTGIDLAGLRLKSHIFPRFARYSLDCSRSLPGRT